MDQRDNQVTLQAKEEKQAQLNEMMNPKVTIGAYIALIAAIIFFSGL